VKAHDALQIGSQPAAKSAVEKDENAQPRVRKRKVDGALHSQRRKGVQ
jgi:hypothetical protein